MYFSKSNLIQVLPKNSCLRKSLLCVLFRILSNSRWVVFFFCNVIRIAIITVLIYPAPPNEKVVLFFTNVLQCRWNFNDHCLRINTSKYLKWRYNSCCITWMIEPQQESLHTLTYSRSFNQIAYSCPCGMCSTNNRAFCQKSLFLQWIVCGKFLHAIWLSIFTFHSWHEFISLPLPHISFWGFEE